MPRTRKEITPFARSARRGQLLTLTDQGVGKRIPAELFDLSGRDRSWNLYADQFIRANRPQFEALSLQAQFTPTPNSVDLVLHPDGVIGAVPLLAPHTQKITSGVLVKPRFGWNGIGILLSAIGWSAAPELLKYPLVPGSAREVPPWVLAGPMLQRFAALLHELNRGFRLQEEIRETPRGQILWPKYCTLSLPHGRYHQLPCRFPDLGPDLLLRAFLRWGLQKIRSSLSRVSGLDVIARHLVEQADVLLVELQDVPARAPDPHTLDQLARTTVDSTTLLRQGLEALGWILDERGLAEDLERDGLAWRLTMYELFERWTETIVRDWARSIGGTLQTASSSAARFPIHWERPGRGTLTDLAPDLVVQTRDTVYILDAKYKGHLEELDDDRWRALGDTLHAEHRHDLHQVLAYTSLFDAPRIVTLLVYPVFPGTWASLARRGETVTRARLPSGTRQIEVGLIALPIELQPGQSVHELSRPLEILCLPLNE